MRPGAKNIEDPGEILESVWETGTGTGVIFSRFSGGPRQVQSEGGGARHGQPATRGGAEKITPVHTPLYAPFRPQHTLK